MSETPSHNDPVRMVRCKCSVILVVAPAGSEVERGIDEWQERQGRKRDNTAPVQLKGGGPLDGAVVALSDADGHFECPKCHARQ